MCNFDITKDMKKGTFTHWNIIEVFEKTNLKNVFYISLLESLMLLFHEIYFQLQYLCNNHLSIGC